MNRPNYEKILTRLEELIKALPVDERAELEASARAIRKEWAFSELLAALQLAVKQLDQCQEFIAEQGFKMAAEHLDLSLVPSRAAIAKAEGL